MRQRTLKPNNTKPGVACRASGLGAGGALGPLGIWRGGEVVNPVRHVRGLPAAGPTLGAPVLAIRTGALRVVPGRPARTGGGGAVRGVRAAVAFGVAGAPG
jgi:hypothetical protein